MSPRSSIVTVITVAATVVVLASAGGASAAQRAVNTTATPSHVATQTTAVAITAFPTGGQGSGSEATCAAYTRLLQRDAAAVKYTEDVSQMAAQALMDDDVDAAMDAGCAVMF
jgi:cytochrome c556